MKTKPIDFRQSENYANFMESVGWEVIDLSSMFPKKTKQFGYLYRSPYLKIKHLQIHRVDPNINLNKLEYFAKQNNIYSLRIGFNATQKSRPKKLTRSLSELGYEQIPWCNSPTKTLIISSKGRSSRQLLKSLKPKTRYNINLAKKKKINIKKFDLGINKPSKDILKQFWFLVRETLVSNKISHLSYSQFIQLLNSLKSSAQLFVAFHDSKMVAGILFVKTKTTLYYTLNGSTSSGKRLFAPTLLVWKGISYMSKHHIKHLDFEGIVDGRNPELTSTWGGFSRFKQSFSGVSVNYIMPYQKTYPSIHHKIMKAIIGKDYSYVLPSIYPTRVHFF
jgi:lipid II:glycine glycyltransferase (peptidoglycan interpeptide bridge formation enzyme)